jgi:hypothetical protein
MNLNMPQLCSLTEMNTRCIFWGKGGKSVRMTNLPPSCAFVMKSGNLNFLVHSGLLQACNGTALPYLSCVEFCNVYRRQTAGTHSADILSHRSNYLIFMIMLHRTISLKCESFILFTRIQLDTLIFIYVY